MKNFIEETQKWLNHRLRQLIWKRWKRPGTRYKMLRKNGTNHEIRKLQKGLLVSIKKRNNPSGNNKHKIIKWGLKDMNQLYKHRYLKG